MEKKTSAAGQDAYIHFPLILHTFKQKFLLNSMKTDSNAFKEAVLLTLKEKKAHLTFYSSQVPFVLETIHKFADAFIPEVSPKIDPLLRELVKNAEKENITIIAKRAGLIGQNLLHAPLDVIGKILKEKFTAPEGSIPLLYHYSEVAVSLQIYLNDNQLFFEIENYGVITPEIHKMIEKRIFLGTELAAFDLRQEFEMKPFEGIQNKIREFFLVEYTEEQFVQLWKLTFEESFEDYWNESPYFLLLSAGKHSSFYPYFATAYIQLKNSFNNILLPEKQRFSAEMGYIQCAFVIEANRSLYGTYGKILTPVSKGEKTIAGFIVGMPHIEVEFENHS